MEHPLMAYPLGRNQIIKVFFYARLNILPDLEMFYLQDQKKYIYFVLFFHQRKRKANQCIYWAILPIAH